MTSKHADYRKRYKEEKLKCVRVWIHEDDSATEAKLKSHDKRAEVRKARQK